MKLSAPIHQLKRQARVAARAEGVPLHKALDAIAAMEGYKSWSHLAAQYVNSDDTSQLLDAMAPEKMLLLAARPGQGKTLAALDAIARIALGGRQAYFFTLDFHEAHVADALRDLGYNPAALQDKLVVDTSDDICAAHIIQKLTGTAPGAVAVVDFPPIGDKPPASSRSASANLLMISPPET